MISKESRCDDKSCSSFSKDRLDSRLNFDLLLQYIIVASLISILRTSHKSRKVLFVVYVIDEGVLKIITVLVVCY